MITIIPYSYYYTMTLLLDGGWGSILHNLKPQSLNSSCHVLSMFPLEALYTVLLITIRNYRKKGSQHQHPPPGWCLSLLSRCLSGRCFEGLALKGSGYMGFGVRVPCLRFSARFEPWALSMDPSSWGADLSIMNYA